MLLFNQAVDMLINLSISIGLDSSKSGLKPNASKISLALAFE